MTFGNKAVVLINDLLILKTDIVNMGKPAQKIQIQDHGLLSVSYKIQRLC